MNAALITYLHKELTIGLEMADDPINANLPDLNIRTTSIYSPWYAQVCSVCFFKFREGDKVRVCPKCKKVYHSDDQYQLYCWEEHFANGHICTKGQKDRFSDLEIPTCDFCLSEKMKEKKSGESNTIQKNDVSTDTIMVKQFVTGLEKIWRPFDEQAIEKIEPGSPIVGRDCPWCRFKIRAGDWAVKCPCGCGTYFHQDIFRHLNCWNGWNGIEGNDHCPNTGKSYHEQSTNT